MSEFLNRAKSAADDFDKIIKKLDGNGGVVDEIENVSHFLKSRSDFQSRRLHKAYALLNGEGKTTKDGLITYTPEQIQQVLRMIHFHM